MAPTEQGQRAIEAERYAVIAHGMCHHHGWVLRDHQLLRIGDARSHRSDDHLEFSPPEAEGPATAGAEALLLH